jgi:hypothetical protein
MFCHAEALGKAPAMRAVGIIMAGAVLAWASPALAAGALHKSHCRSDELTVFACPVGRKTVSLCASADRSPLQYRFGPPGRIELSYPEKPTAPREAFMGSLALYGRGGGSYVRFTLAGVTYTLYRYIGSGHEEDGLVVTRGDKKLMASKCPNFADVDHDWWLQIDKGALPPGLDEPVVP